MVPHTRLLLLKPPRLSSSSSRSSSLSLLRSRCCSFQRQHLSNLLLYKNHSKHHHTTRCFSSSKSGTSTITSSPSWTQHIISTLGCNFQVSIYDPPQQQQQQQQENSSSFSSTIPPPQPVLCLPGALGSGPSDFQNLLEGGLGSKFQIIALNPRGIYDHNHTSSGSVNDVFPEREFPLDFYIQDAIDADSVMSELFGHKKYNVMGWSDGANTAIHLAALQPRGKIKKLVVWGGNSYTTQEDCDSWESVRDINNWSTRMKESKASIHGGLDKLQTLNKKATDGWINIYKDPSRAGDICLQSLHQVKCPTLVIHGAKDVICDMKHPKYIARQIANSQLVIFADGKHNVHQRHSEAFNNVVKSFLLDGRDDDDEKMEDGIDTVNSPGTETTISSSKKKKQVEEVEPIIDEIAYAFMGSKALFTALRGGVFDAIGGGGDGINNNPSVSFEDIETNCQIGGERLRTLLSACVALKLIRCRINDEGDEEYTLPKSSAEQLVRGSKRYWGDYITGQVDKQFYNRMQHLDDIMTLGNSASSDNFGYEEWFESDPDAAKQYTEAQHNGSLATAYALHKRLPDLATKFPTLRMLDVGGGSGAFSIATARKIPTAECVVLDLPNVTKVADGIISNEKDASVPNRVTTLSLSATAPGEWQGIVEDSSFDVVLMSYVSGSIPSFALQGLYENAYRVLKPGGLAIIHDFFVDNDGTGPQNAALWALAHVTVNPEGMGLRPNRIVNMLTAEGFVAPKVDDLISGATQLIVATKPGDSR